MPSNSTSMFRLAIITTLILAGACAPSQDQPAQQEDSGDVSDAADAAYEDVSDTESDAIQEDASDTLEPDVSEGDPTHGSVYTLSGEGFGTREDYNEGQYSTHGHRHIVGRATEFAGAESQLPEENTKAGWQEHLDGVYPILTSNDFNDETTESKATLELTGGPTQSGRWLRRIVDEEVQTRYPANARLRNFNLWDTAGYYPEMYASVYILLPSSYGAGKTLRFMWTEGDSPNRNMWVAKPPGTQITARAEHGGGGVPGLWADNAVHPDGQWVRYEIITDFEAGEISIYADGVALTDESNGHGEILDDWVGAGAELDYFLLGNTIDTISEPGQFVGWASPYFDLSFKRVELTDSPVWGEETQKVVQPPIAWADDAISIVIDQGVFSSLEGKYLHVVDRMTSIAMQPL